MPSDLRRSASEPQADDAIRERYPVYADWLEENVPDVPVDALRVLRGWV